MLKCKCGGTKTNMIPNLTPEKAKEIDDLIEALKQAG